MKSVVTAALIATIAGAAPAGEMFSGTHTYTPVPDQWNPIPSLGYRTLVMTGTYEPKSGPIPESPIECRGTNFWKQGVAEADGVCAFGEKPDRWVIRYRMINTDRNAQETEQFRRVGEWTVVGGTGRYEGMAGAGTYWAEVGYNEDGKYRTQWEGEVTIPE